MMVLVRLGLIGPAGMIAVLIVMVEFNRELVNAKMETKMIVQDHQLMSNNVTENHVNLMKWSTGKTIGVFVGSGGKLQYECRTSISLIRVENRFPMVKYFLMSVSHIVYRTTAAWLPKLML